MVFTSLATLVCAGVFMYAWLIGRPVPVEVEPTRGDQYAVVEGVDFDGNQPAVLRVTLEPGGTVLAPGETGLVTEVAVRPGDEITQGTRIFSVDGAGVYAYLSDSPLYRSLGVGDKGPDVMTVQRFLASVLGIEVKPDGVFGAQTQQLVRQWQKTEGLTVNGRLEVSRFARIPRELSVGEVSLLVGKGAPELGAVVVRESARLAGLTLAGADALLERSERLFFIAEGVRIELVDQGEKWAATEPDAVLRLLSPAEATPGEGAGIGTAEATSSDPVVRTERELAGRVMLVEPVPAAAVPASALLVGRGGKACVWVRGADGSRELISGIAVLGTSVSGAAVTDAVDLVGHEVLLGAQAVEHAPPCP